MTDRTDGTERKGRLHGKAAMVTGAATGIGEAIAHTFVREGARVVVNGLPADPVDDVVHAIAKEYGDGTAVGHRGDVSSERDADAYGGTKAFIHAFIRGVAHEQAKYGVRANVVAPGPIDTAWTHMSSGAMNATMEKTKTAATPLGRLGTAAEVASVYAFLASDEASFVTGAIYAVDGGITIGKGPVGEEAGRAARKQPDAELRLEHTHDGLRNKDYDSAL